MQRHLLLRTLRAPVLCCLSSAAVSLQLPTSHTQNQVLQDLRTPDRELRPQDKKPRPRNLLSCRKTSPCPRRQSLQKPDLQARQMVKAVLLLFQDSDTLGLCGYEGPAVPKESRVTT